VNAETPSTVAATPPTATTKHPATHRALNTLVAVNVALAVTLSFGLVVYLSKLPSKSLAPAAGTAGDSLVAALAILAIAGGLGGSLCNLRGISRNLQEEGNFPTQDLLPFYLRPVTGAINGLFTFFLGNFIVAALARPETAAWGHIEGLLPFVGIALLAGFAVQEFLQKLKVVAISLFSSKPLPKEGK
jgi:hypothetical protein